jgi:hypothetical protein
MRYYRRFDVWAKFTADESDGRLHMAFSRVAVNPLGGY